MEMINLNCENCNKPIIRKLCEHKANKKRGYSIACSLSCGAVLRNKKYSKGNIDNFKGKTRQDQFSSFRYFINKAKIRSKDKKSETDLTVEYLKTLWESQRGVCPYSGYKMQLPHNTQDFHIKGTPYKASLDRIDSNKGYIKDNVEFVCLSVNLAKKGFSKKEMLDFFKPIKNLLIE